MRRIRQVIQSVKDTLAKPEFRAKYARRTQNAAYAALLIGLFVPFFNIAIFGTCFVMQGISNNLHMEKGAYYNTAISLGGAVLIATNIFIRLTMTTPIVSKVDYVSMIIFGYTLSLCGILIDICTKNKHLMR